jgi:hypothetical protein
MTFLVALLAEVANCVIIDDLGCRHAVLGNEGVVPLNADGTYIIVQITDSYRPIL